MLSDGNFSLLTKKITTMTNENLTRSPFECARFNISDLLEDNQPKLIVPVYQRPYEWGETQLLTLVQDLLDYSFENSEPYSIGTIICEKKTTDSGEEQFFILDGQQRLTSLDLLLRCLDELVCKFYKEDKGAIPEDNRKRGRLISSYQYLDTKQKNPEWTKQKQILINVLSEKAEKSPNRIKFIEKLETNIYKKVAITRVTIPIKGTSDQESPLMFEIVNTRGQSLTQLDILKARLLGLLENQNERQIFNYVWTRCPEILGYNSQGYNLKEMKKFKNKSNKELKIKNSSFAEILDYIPLSINSDEEQETTKDIDTDPDSALPTPLGTPPINMQNMLVVALELLKHATHTEQYKALSSEQFQQRFDWLIRYNGTSQKKQALVWNFMTMLICVIKAINTWSYFRSENKDKWIEDKQQGRIQQLTLTYLASSGYKSAGQYWLLLLAQTIASRVTSLPNDAFSFLDAVEKIQALKFNPEQEQDTFLHLLLLSFKNADTDDPETGTVAVFKLLENHTESITAQIQAIQAKITAKESLNKWSYGLPWWNLYFLDWMLLRDARQNFKALRETIDKTTAASSPTTPEEEEVKTALIVFKNEKLKDFQQKIWQLHTVTRGAVEHWLARDNAQDDKVELELRDGFGNLALIDASTNSALMTKSPRLKAADVIELANSTPKLLWLAYFSQSFEPGKDFDGKHVPAVSEFWLRYIQNFPIENCP